MSEVEGEGYRYEPIGGEEAVDREGAHPAIDIGTARPMQSETGGWQKRQHRRQDAGLARSFVSGVGVGEAGVGEAVMRHQQKHARRSNHARQSCREHADQNANINDGTKKGNAGLDAEIAKRVGAFSKGSRRAPEPKHLAISRDNKEHARE